ncbi:hypothetical protein ACOMHN_047946 [Nucella lapillus]
MAGDATSALATVQETFFQWLEKESLFFSTNIGTSTYNNRLANLSMDVFDTQLESAEPTAHSYDIFMDSLKTFVSNYAWRHFGALNPISFLEGFYLDLNYIIDITPFGSKQDFENYISRLQAWPTQKAVPGQIGEAIGVTPTHSTLFKPFNQTLDGLQLSQTERSVLYVFRRLLVNIMQFPTYLLHTRGTYGVGGLPSGGSYYRACLKWHLSVDTSPSQVHQTGLREVDRIAHLMRQVMTKQGINGSISQYYDHLKSEPQFHKSTADEVLQAHKDIIFNRITPKLPMLFKNIPPKKIVGKPLPYDGPYGMYSDGSEDGTRPGTFYANVFRPNETNTFGMVSLALHEAVPGHHMQVSGSGTKLMSRKSLEIKIMGEELGVYANDYELMGRYGDEMFRAVRLVVDTGMHYFGWTRERAIKFLSARTPQPPAEVAIEIDRYITWPGQACAYKIGELKIKELRQRAATALGSNFDVRDFHSLLLTNGPVPLSVMDTMVNDYIADQRGQIGGSVIG